MYMLTSCEATLLIPRMGFGVLNRTPLNGVLGMLELLREQTLEKTTERFVHMAYISGSLLLNLINDILDLSKIEAGHMEISSDPFQMEDLLDYSLEIFKFKAREKHVKLSLQCSPKVPKCVIGDVSRLRQVLLNLLSNAIKFTNSGSITVKCSVVHSPDLSKQFVKLLFQVIDTGVGIDDEEKSRLFSLFTKLERTRKNNPTGSGLGLAICKQLVELMGGEIDVESVLGEGSEFFFTVVVRRIEEDHMLIDPQKFPAILATEGGILSRANTAAAVKDVVPKHARILVVEDNEFNWEVVKSFFMEDNHLLQWEINGRDAYLAYKEHYESYDLVLMDCEMPIMNGYDATRNIRKFEREMKIPRIPIIGVTAYAMSGDRKRCLDSGMDEFVVKPISKNALRNAVRKWMRVRFLGQKTLPRDPSTLSDDGEYSDPGAANLVPASTHKEALDLDRAISDLELEDPMMLSHGGGGALPSMMDQESLLMALTTVSEGKSNQSNTSDTISRTLGVEHEAVADASSSSFYHGTNQSLYLDAVSDSHSSYMQSGIDVYAASQAAASALNASKPSQMHQFNGMGRGSDDGSNQARDDRSESSNALSSTPRSGTASVVVPEDIPIPDGDPIDYAKGVEQCGGNENLFMTLLEKYASVCEEYMGRIETAYATSDYVVLRRESHSLKGSSAYVAAMRVSKAAFRVQLATERVMDENQVCLDDHASLRDAFQLLKKENRAVLGYLRRNFSFRPTSAAGSVDVKKSKSSDDQGACTVM